MQKNKKIKLGKINYIILIIGVLLITIGFIIMNTGDFTISPIILILAYVVIIPLSLILPSGNEK